MTEERESRFSNYEIRAFALEGVRFGDHLAEPEGHEKYVKNLMALRNRIEDKWRADSVEGIWSQSVPWSEKTFPQSTVESIANHILSEAKELAANPYDPVEAADILLLLGHLQFKLKVTLALEAARKLAINKERKWGSVNDQGFVEHVRDEQEEKAEPKGEERPTIEVDAKWYETCVETSKGELTGRTGKILFYKIGGRTFAKPPEWDDEPQTSEVRPLQPSNGVGTLTRNLR